ncbi:MAG: GH1 family beta-glucosidase [Clostridia bacterium]
MGFKNDFTWGSATASYQVEGGAFEDGKGLSIWDTTTHMKNYAFENQNGDTACDSYHRYKEDVRIMKELEIKAYRYSISWARVLPDGTGTVNEKGLDYYDRLTDELLKNNIEPYVTLFHWDLPYELHKKGGWLNPDMGKIFGEYAHIVSKRLSDRVKNFFTINEPQCVIGAGYVQGDHAPALKVSDRDALLGIHNTLLAHGYGYGAIRANVPNAKIGYAPIGSVCHPVRNTKECIEAAKRETMAVYEPWWSNTAWSDPIMFGHYPIDMLQKFESIMPKGFENDMKTINTSLDFYAFNTYQSSGVDVDEKGNVFRPKRKDGYARTMMDWAVEQDCLYWGAKFFYERYKKPIIISENGVSCTDWVCRDGKVHDSMRADYIQRHIASLKRAADEGVDIDGYFLWSLMDNFEWKMGYSQRFGIVYVDFETKERIIKDSAYAYRDIIRANGENL